MAEKLAEESALSEARIFTAHTADDGIEGSMRSIVGGAAPSGGMLGPPGRPVEAVLLARDGARDTAVANILRSRTSGASSPR